jgi:phosphate uptake regulator
LQPRVSTSCDSISASPSSPIPCSKRLLVLETLVMNQVQKALHALTSKDLASARALIAGDYDVDAMEVRIDETRSSRCRTPRAGGTRPADRHGLLQDDA